MNSEKSPLLTSIPLDDAADFPLKKRRSFNVKSPIYSLAFGLDKPPCPLICKQDYYHMGLFQRWKLYGKIPWSMVIHISLIFLFSFQLFFSDWGAFVQGQMTESIQRALIIGSNTNFQFAQGEMKAVYYDGHDVLSDLELILKNYYRLDNASLGMKTVRSFADNPELSPVIILTSYPSRNSHKLEKTVYHTSAEFPLGQLPVCNNNYSIFLTPLGEIQRKDVCRFVDGDHLNRQLFLSMDSLSVKLNIYTKVMTHPNIFECYQWKVSLDYSYSHHRAKLKLNSDHNVQYCRGYHGAVRYPSLDVAVAFLSLVLIISSLKLLLLPLWICYCLSQQDTNFATINFMGKIKFALSIPISSKSRGYHLLIIMASSATLIFTILKSNIVPDKFSWGPTTRVWLGFAAFLNYISLPHYIYDVFFRNQFYHITKTIRVAIPDVLRVIICFIPIMLGYITIGTMMFGHFNPRFMTFSQTTITLFGVANGDEIRATIKSLQHENDAIGVFGAIYVISYICLMMYVVLAIIISIMQKTYADVRRKIKTSKMPTVTTDKAKQAIERFRRTNSNVS